MSSKFWLLGVETRDVSYAEREITTCKVNQIHKVTIIFTQNGQKFVILSKDSCHFLNLRSFGGSFFSSELEINHLI